MIKTMKPKLSLIFFIDLLFELPLPYHHQMVVAFAAAVAKLID